MSRMFSRRMLPVCLVLAAAILPACSSSHFDQEWKSPSVQTTADPAVTLAGKWEGTWQSNGQDYYNGLCQAVITPDSTSPTAVNAAGQHYRVDVKQYYFNLFPREYSLILVATPGQDEKTALTGEKDFGAKADGVYKLEGDAEGRTMNLSYTSVKDFGTFTLRRYPPLNP